MYWMGYIPSTGNAPDFENWHTPILKGSQQQALKYARKLCESDWGDTTGLKLDYIDEIEAIKLSKWGEKVVNLRETQNDSKTSV